MTYCLIKSELRLTLAGLNDEKIKTEYEKNKDKKKSVVGAVFDKILLVFCCAALFISFGMSMSLSACTSGEKVKEGMPAVNVVRSGSMSYISPNHKYLKQGEVTDQLDKFDVVFISAPPAEMDLEVNDIVVYEFNGDFIIHRIVAIEEPSASHPDQRYFLLHGDANDISDRFPVTYDQIKGIYNGTRIPFIGSFILFMQSPAGWLCILLVIFSMIVTPIAEKKISKVRQERLDIIYPSENTESTDDAVSEQESNADQEDDPTLEQEPECDDEEDSYDECEDDSESGQEFAPKTEQKSEAYEEEEILSENIEESDSQTKPTSYSKQTPDSEQECDTDIIPKGIVEVEKEASPVIEQENTSEAEQLTVVDNEQQTVSDNGQSVVLDVEQITAIMDGQDSDSDNKPISVPNYNLPSRFDLMNKSRSVLPFRQKLDMTSDEVKERYNSITSFLFRVVGVRIIEAKRSETFKKGNIALIRFVIRGKTLNAYIGINPKEYEDTKYIFTDVSGVKQYANYPMRVKITSDRQARWVIELLNDIVAKNSLELSELPAPEVEIEEEKPFSFSNLKKKKPKSFKQRIKKLPVAKERYEAIAEELSQIDGVRLIEGKKSVTYKLRSIPIIKFKIRGKTLNAYLGLSPERFTDTKYIFTDVSSVKSYSNYPMRIKVTSNRQVKWTKELIRIIVSGDRI